jgi:hypothetical protein
MARASHGELRSCTFCQMAVPIRCVAIPGHEPTIGSLLLLAQTLRVKVVELFRGLED